VKIEIVNGKRTAGQRDVRLVSSASTISRRSILAAPATPMVRASLRPAGSCAAWTGVRKIQMAPNTEAQLLTPPVRILKACRQFKRTHSHDVLSSRLALARRQSSSRIDQRT
jgi:hypothetical protein